MQSDFKIVKGETPPGTTPLKICQSGIRPQSHKRRASLFLRSESIGWDYRASSLPTYQCAPAPQQTPYGLQSPRNGNPTTWARGTGRDRALVLLLFTSPLFLVAAILIKLNSSGPVFFKHKRIGPVETSSGV